MGVFYDYAMTMIPAGVAAHRGGDGPAAGGAAVAVVGGPGVGGRAVGVVMLVVAAGVAGDGGGCPCLEYHAFLCMDNGFKWFQESDISLI